MTSHRAFLSSRRVWRMGAARTLKAAALRLSLLAVHALAATQSRYIAAVGESLTDATYRLADYYGLRTGELVTEDRRRVRALRIDGPEEFDWLLTLGAVVRTEGGESLRKAATMPVTNPTGHLKKSLDGSEMGRAVLVTFDISGTENGEP
jgi:hypothetical protein